MTKIVKFIKNEVVLCIAFLLALLSMIITPPSAEYLNYVDYSVLAILFCLMVTVQGFGKTGLFGFLSSKLTSRFKNTRTLSAALVLLCFALSMFITNDVALLTFVPLTIMLFKGREKAAIYCIVIETAAANLGSMATPIGNPQNLFIYSRYNYNPADFFAVMLPISGVCLALVLASVFLVPSEKIERDDSAVSFKLSRNFFVYAVIFAVCICTVARILDYRITLGVTLAAALIFDRKILAKPDYALLFTFVCFFVFVGNISAVPQVKEFIGSILDGRELLLGCGLSQIISNVPCAIMLSGFTQNSDALLLGVNIGGMGTLIASLASLISFKLYSRSENARKGKYFAVFTVYNFVFLAILLGFEFVLGKV